MSINEKDIERRRLLLEKDIRAREKKMRRRWRDLKSEMERRVTVERFVKEHSVAVVGGAAVVGVLIGALLARGEKKSAKRRVETYPRAEPATKQPLSRKILRSLFDAGKDALAGYLSGLAAQKLQDYVTAFNAPTRDKNKHQ